VAAVVAAVVVVVVAAATTVWGLTRSGGTRPEEPVLDPMVTKVKAVRAAAVALAAGQYEVDFDFTWREPDMSAFQAKAISMLWSGTMRSTGGDSPQWTLSSEVTYKQEDGSRQRLDAVTIVDDGQTRYFDTLNTTFDGLEWAAITGSGRVNNFWRPAFTSRTGEVVPARTAPMPEVDPLDYLDITSAGSVQQALDPVLGDRYTFQGLATEVVLGDRTARAVELFGAESSFGRPDFLLDVYVVKGRLSKLVVRSRTPTRTSPALSLTVRDPGGPVTVEIPKPGTFADRTKTGG
jgi:hypothetical protein